MQKLLLPLILLLGQGFTGVLALTGCGRQIISERIVGGVDSVIGEWPWQVNLQMNDLALCGGSIITDSWVLTAAHCFITSQNVSEFTVYFGVNQLSYLQYHSRKVKQIIVHPNFTEEGSSGDIALVELENPLTFTPHILPICLPSQSVNLPEGTKCWATGWGNVQDGVPLASPETLQKVKLPLIDNKNCESMYRSSFGYKPSIHMIMDDMICAGYKEGQKDSCQGDSGGPLACNINGVWLQVGINSWGFGCAEPNHPGVYTRVQYYQSWMQKYVPDLQYSNGGNSISNSFTSHQNISSYNATQNSQNETVIDDVSTNATYPRMELWQTGGALSHVCSMVNIMLVLVCLVLFL